MNTLEICESKIGCGYWFGAQGEKPTPELLQILIGEQGIEHYHLPNGVNAEKWMKKKQVFDCSGLIVFALQEQGLISKQEDYTASALFNNLCPLQFQRSDMLQPGDLVFRSSVKSGITHVGIYKGNKVVIEARGTAYGVVYGNIQDFNLYGRLRFNIPTVKPIPTVSEDWKKIINECKDIGALESSEYWLTPKTEYKAEYVQKFVTNLYEIANGKIPDKVL